MTERIVIDGADCEQSGFMLHLDEVVRQRAEMLAEAQDAEARELLRLGLPNRLGWLIDHPGLLKVVLKLVPRWRPRFIVGGEQYLFVPGYSTEAAARAFGARYVAECVARGSTPRATHVVFTELCGEARKLSLCGR